MLVKSKLGLITSFRLPVQFLNDLLKCISFSFSFKELYKQPVGLFKCDKNRILDLYQK